MQESIGTLNTIRCRRHSTPSRGEPLAGFSFEPRSPIRGFLRPSWRGGITAMATTTAQPLNPVPLPDRPSDFRQEVTDKYHSNAGAPALLRGRNPGARRRFAWYPVNPTSERSYRAATRFI